MEIITISTSIAPRVFEKWVRYWPQHLDRAVHIVRVLTNPGCKLERTAMMDLDLNLHSIIDEDLNSISLAKSLLPRVVVSQCVDRSASHSRLGADHQENTRSTLKSYQA